MTTTPHPLPQSASWADHRSAQEADYESAGFGHELVPGSRPALVVVDPVRAYSDPASALFAGVDEQVLAMRRLLDAVRATRTAAGPVPVVVTQVSYRSGELEGGVFWRKVPALSAYLEGSPLAAIIDGLEPRAGEVLITKQYPSAFFGTTLAATLTAQRVDTVLIAGFSTSGCVRATALDAMQHGFVPVVVEEAVGDRDAAVHAANLFDIRHKIGEVWPATRALAYLAGLQAPAGNAPATP